ncbi:MULTISPECIES: glycoside hydrolase family 43 protein [unclassified Paenibacillus]|uniref:glycoside hydrolase family 43 protein n=1 Tax=unclassified Paenibacillus TaxID=185978 RepID=UPI00096D5EF8|nr:glycoside hydrolase 43 family protein [Paenibacillus sp. FSL H8-0259]OMF27266.1 glycoside hydrolase [Paenibacillus sp. FSL H8-0259]
METINTPWVSDLGNGRYRNPVLYADYSDPDVIRAGDDYYMTASSFNHMPGLPILHSRDLVNWTIVNHALDRLDLPGYDQVQHGKGVWAPSLRHHDGKFWIFFGTPDEGIFMTQAGDPLGKWTVPHLVKAAKGWIDPCPFWDEDGQAYLVHAFAKSRSGIKHILHVCGMSPDGRELLDEGRLIIDGTVDHPTLEGPKMYKRDGWYYILAPAGGVSTGWQAAFRSRSIYGPYEDQIVLEQGDTLVNGPHQGGWVETPEGESWFLHFQDKGAYGRIVHLQPVEWIDGWPVMGKQSAGSLTGVPVSEWCKPGSSGTGTALPAAPRTSDDFADGRPGLQWQWQANPQDGWLASGHPGPGLRLRCAPLGAQRLYDAPQLLMQKFAAPAFTAQVQIKPHFGALSERAGLVVLGHKAVHLSLFSGEDGGLCLGRFESLPASPEEEAEQECAFTDDFVKLDSDAVYLQLTVLEDAECRLAYSLDGEAYTDLGAPFRLKEGEGAWVGSKFGLFALACGPVNAAAENGYAEFGRFEVR